MNLASLAVALEKLGVMASIKRRAVLDLSNVSDGEFLSKAQASGATPVVRGWSYQDFSAGAITGTSVTLTASENGAGTVFDAARVFSGTAAITLAADGEAIPYTGSTKLFSSKVHVTGHTLDAITLSGVPHASWGDLRIWYLYEYDALPTDYLIAPKFIQGTAFTELDALFITEQEHTAGLDTKVDKITGMGLSTEDFTSAEKTKLAGIATGATSNQTDAHLLDRTNHTGTQAISTVSGLQTALDAKADQATTYTKTETDTAIAAIVNAAPSTLDTLNELAAALGNDPNFATTVSTQIGSKESAITAGTTAQYWRGDKSWQDLGGDVRSIALTGLSTSTNSAAVATDTILAAIGKLQAQINFKPVLKMQAAASAEAFTVSSDWVPHKTPVVLSSHSIFTVSGTTGKIQVSVSGDYHVSAMTRLSGGAVTRCRFGFWRNDGTSDGLQEDGCNLLSPYRDGASSSGSNYGEILTGDVYLTAGHEYNFWGYAVYTSTTSWSNNANNTFSLHLLSAY